MEVLCQDRALSLFGLDADEWAVRMKGGRSSTRLCAVGLLPACSVRVRWCGIRLAVGLVEGRGRVPRRKKAEFAEEAFFFVDCDVRQQFFGVRLPCTVRQDSRGVFCSGVVGRDRWWKCVATLCDVALVFMRELVGVEIRRSSARRSRRSLRVACHLRQPLSLFFLPVCPPIRSTSSRTRAAPPTSPCTRPSSSRTTASWGSTSRRGGTSRTATTATRKRYFACNKKKVYV